MRPGFRENLETFNALAKEQNEAELIEDPIDQKYELETIENVLEYLLHRAAYNHGTEVKDQRQIFELQQKKQAIMQQLKADIAHLDDTEYRPELSTNGKRVVYDNEQKKFFAQPTNKEARVELSIGEIMTDGEWGINYYLDPKTVPLNVRKRYLIEQAKRQLLDLLNTQIIVNQASSQVTHENPRAIYQDMQRRETTPELNINSGMITERMVRNLLKKIALDFDVDFTILQADVYQDVEQAIDFIIRKKQYNRGVEVQNSRWIKNVGVQLTRNTKPKIVRHKAKIIERSKHEKLFVEDHIDDIVLVIMPLEEVMEVYSKWNRHKTIGGPEKLLELSIKEQIFRGVLEGIYTPEEIDEQWQKVASGMGDNAQ